ncbi:MAG TPA: peptidoglycan DD-metalloendopeptidase family protein [Myxococcales bacterium]|jgi:murein DD-endopeptidase MepM/ murein hydrolase activator NlpD
MPPVTKTTTNTNLQAVQQQQQKALQQKALKQGAEGQAVKDVQQKLKEQGFNPGAVDGQFGPKTDLAVRNFQKANGLEVDGVVGSKTRGKLGITGTTDLAGPKNPPTPQAGAKLDCFPIVGKDGTTTNARYNIGYDKNWSNFNPDSASQNSDFSKSATNASHPSGHLGVDVFAPKGQPVVAPVTGTVIKAGYDQSGGNRVTIQRGNEYFYMAHLDQIAPGIRPGAKVDAGTKIGTVGDTGKAKGTAPHLHFSIYRGSYNNSVNPFSSLYSAHQSARANANDFF